MSSHYNQDIHGWIILDKPQNISSNQILRKIQYELHAKKAGHIGTLDPFATGVLPLAFGEATKLIPYLEGNTKTYVFELEFGTSTSTVNSRTPLPLPFNIGIPCSFTLNLVPDVVPSGM